MANLHIEPYGFCLAYFQGCKKFNSMHCSNCGIVHITQMTYKAEVTFYNVTELEKKIDKVTMALPIYSHQTQKIR